MNYERQNFQFFFHITTAGLILTGCVAPIKRPIRLCPGADSVIDSLSLLRSRSQNAVPLKATGRCRLQYYADVKPHKENFLVKLWANPPSQIHLQGDVAFDAKGIVIGSNEYEFWLSVKPKEVSSYWWGRWSEQSHLQKLTISPKTVLEALGIAGIANEQDWSLSDEGSFDVLTERNDRDVIIRKLYIGRCDYLVRRIEYFDAGRPVVVTELNKYKEVAGAFFVPAVIKIIRQPTSNGQDSISFALSLSSIKEASLTARQRSLIFTRPKPRRVKHIYKIVNGNVIEQPQ